MSGAFEAWIGRSEEATDSICPARARLLAATLDADPARCGRGALEQGTPLPPLWHWIGFLPAVAHAGLGPDGHPARGGFLPPVPLERRMWAGGRLEFLDTIRVGEPLRRVSEILSVKEKDGNAGPMVFVTVRHVIETPRGPAVHEEQDIVYVAMPDAWAPPPPRPVSSIPGPPDWDEPFVIDSVRLFRFSAVTFNAHRIHYERGYAMEVEKYPGLVVHGPFQAMVLMEAARRRHGGAMPRGYRFRGVRPLFDHDRMRLLGWAVGAGQPDGLDQGASWTLATANGEDLICMQAEVTW